MICCSSQKFHKHFTKINAPIKIAYKRYNSRQLYELQVLKAASKSIVQISSQRGNVKKMVSQCCYGYLKLEKASFRFVQRIFALCSKRVGVVSKKPSRTSLIFLLHLKGYTHLFLEAVSIATHRQLSPSHPVFRLLAPYLRHVIPINW